MKVLIVPDVHGRSFWEDVLPFVNSDEYNKIIFLGDYLDPYYNDKISGKQAYKTFLKILDLKKAHPDKIVLLLGNHDLGYLDTNICDCRRIVELDEEIFYTFLADKQLFDITYKIETDDKTILFSHAGFTRTFVNILKDKFMDDDEWSCIESLNDWFHQNMTKHVKTVYNLLAMVGRERGGMHPTGSCVWADVTETTYAESCLENTIQIFGHTILDYIPMYTSLGKTMNCIDSQRVFVFDTDNYELSELNKDVDKKDN